MKIDLDDKTDVLAYHKKLLAEALKEKEDLKTKFKNWQNFSKNLNGASVEITAYTLALKKVEAQLLCHKQNQLAYEQKIRFIDLDDKTDVLAYHKKLLAEALKEKEDLKTKFKNWQNFSKNLNGLLNTQMSANDKFGLGYGDYRYGSILSYENEVLQSMFMNKECDLEDTPVNDRYAEGMHAVPPSMTGNYMPSGPDVEIDYSKFPYGPKQTSVDESDSKPVEYASSESESSVETTTSMPTPVDNALKIVCEPKMWTDALIIEEYESDSDDDSVSNVHAGNKAHLADYQEFKGGSVAFGGSNGWITGKGKIKTGRTRFFFTDIDCLVLSLDFKLPDENQVLLKIPRQHNMYNFNLKNIDPFGDLACLFAKALINESNKWHRRLGHKGKQHKASCKAKKVCFVNQPLQILHIDLFGPTSVQKANNSAGTQANDDQGGNSKEIDPNEEHFVLPIWSAYSTTIKSSRDKIEKNTGFKTYEKPGHRQEEGIDYDEVYAPMARIEAIRIFLAFASYMGFIVYQMDVKSAFLYSIIDEEVYVSQPPGFVDPKFPNKVYKVMK
nr:copia protein [Tanacetum cinerariifolium]